MTQPSALFADLVDALARIDVKSMSSQILGASYDDVKALIYPTPPYKLFVIKKRDGSPRVLAEPRLPLKILQKRVLEYLKIRSSPFRPAVHGFVDGRSILTNARQHCSPTQHQLLNIDLQDFFPSITFFRVRGVLQKHPFHLSHEVATVIAHLCTLHGVLPQGAPTSPFLANLVCRGLDRDLTDLARRYRSKYTRYADDITFSFNVRSAERLPAALCTFRDGVLSVGQELNEIITDHSFIINPAKTRLQDRYKRMEVTGLTINEFPNVKRRFIDKIRGALHAWEKYGYSAAELEWQKRVGDPVIAWDSKPWKRQTRTRKTPELKNVLWGKLLYLRMVRGAEDVLYAQLADRYNAAVRIASNQQGFTAPSLPVEPAVRTQRDINDGVFVLEWAGDFKMGTLEEMVGGQGTAFVYKELNLLVTCEHVLRAEVNINSFKKEVSFDAPEMHDTSFNLVKPQTRQSWPAKVLFRDRQLDIALIAFDVESLPPHRFFRGIDAPIQAGSSGYLIGFPNYQPGKLPNISSDRVLNRTMPNRGMDSFTVANAGSIRPGNSGGPFTDESLRVAGVAQRGAFHGTGDDECLCYTIVDTIIARWRMSRQNTVQQPAQP